MVNGNILSICAASDNLRAAQDGNDKLSGEYDVKAARAGLIQHGQRCRLQATPHESSVPCGDDRCVICPTVWEKDTRPLKLKLAIKHAIRARARKLPAPPGKADHRMIYVAGEYDGSQEEVIWEQVLEKCASNPSSTPISASCAEIFKLDLDVTPGVFRRYAAAVVESWEALISDQLAAVRTDWARRMKKGDLVRAKVVGQAALLSYLAAFTMSPAWVWAAVLPFGAGERSMATWSCLATWLDYRQSADALEAPNDKLFKRVSDAGVCETLPLLMARGSREGVSACWRIECLRTPKDYADAAPLRHADSVLIERTREAAVAMHQAFAHHAADPDERLELCKAASDLELAQILVHDICDLGNDLNSEQPTNCTGYTTTLAVVNRVATLASPNRAWSVPSCFRPWRTGTQAALGGHRARALISGEKLWCSTIVGIMEDDLSEPRSAEDSIWRQERLSEVFYGGWRRLGATPRAQSSAISLACAVIAAIGTRKCGFFGVQCGDLTPVPGA
ncbi:hypothetical protein V500_08806 [Pseudogymnoascus sp. VKM F-4518 (FW-2643)]|nr:hypothetical protein V500_08806 [Pseudogymnoascus sp. VKM F-4518 (FW-2643)]